MNDSIKYALDETRIPKSWYNLMADLPSPPALVLHPGTLAPVGPSDLASLFALSLIMQEVSTEREIKIPEPVPASRSKDHRWAVRSATRSRVHNEPTAMANTSSVIPCARHRRGC
jgi:predicted alternative tryptophan synthase beta-subunit